MSRALELAAWCNEGAWHQITLGQVWEIGAELRRLAQVEAEHAALLKAISDAEPVAWVSRIGTPSVSWRQRDIGLLPDTTLLYTLKGIKK